MPESCVKPLQCSTHSPGWYDGPHPANVGGISSGRVCFSWMGVCCQWSSPAKVKRCNGFYVYRLSPTSHCALLYCGNGTAGRKNARGWGLAVVCRLWGGGGGVGRTHGERKRDLSSLTGFWEGRGLLKIDFQLTANERVLQNTSQPMKRGDQVNFNVTQPK